MILQDILVIFTLSVAVIYIFHRLRIPVILGFFLTGLLAGPHGFELVKAGGMVNLLAEVGVVALLFAIGIEFSFRSLPQIRKVLLGGLAQVVLSALVLGLIAHRFGTSLEQAVFIGFLASLSSTAIVLKILQERAEVDSPHGRIILGILIFQDIAVIPMMLLTPLLAGMGKDLGRAFLIFSAQLAMIVLLIFLGTRWIVPWVFHRLAQTKIRELFSLGTVAMCLTVAWMTYSAGLSLALGAFLAGLIISESEYSHQALSGVLPFRDIFSSFFFISLGMLLDVRFLISHPGLVAALTLGVFILKAFSAGLAAALLGFPLRTMVLIGLAIGQVGEFSFIMAKTGSEYGFLRGDLYQIFLAVSILTMALTPYAMAAAPAAARLVLRLPLPRRWKKGSSLRPAARPIQRKGHLVIIGFGLNGRNLARAAKVSGIPYVIVEINPDVVRDERKNREPIYYGDATQEAVLQHMNVKEARAVVVVINDAAATRRITELARRLNSRAYLIVRTRFLEEMGALYQLGADEVIPEEFETSVEIFARVLGKYLLPKEEIERFIAEIRSEGYGMFRSLSKEAVSCTDISQCLPDMEVVSLRLDPDSPLAGKTLGQLAIRSRYGVTVLGLRRGSELIHNPRAETVLLGNDLLILLGQRDKVSALSPLFRRREEAPKSLP